MPSFLERFRENLDNDAQFDKRATKDMGRIFEESGVNLIGMHLAYQHAKELNAKRKVPQQKNYLLNLLKKAAYGSDRFGIDLELNPSLGDELENELTKYRNEPD